MRSILKKWAPWVIIAFFLIFIWSSLKDLRDEVRYSIQDVEYAVEDSWEDEIRYLETRVDDLEGKLSHVRNLLNNNSDTFEDLGIWDRF